MTINQTYPRLKDFAIAFAAAPLLPPLVFSILLPIMPSDLILPGYVLSLGFLVFLSYGAALAGGVPAWIILHLTRTSALWPYGLAGMAIGAVVWKFFWLWDTRVLDRELHPTEALVLCGGAGAMTAGLFWWIAFRKAAR